MNMSLILMEENMVQLIMIILHVMDIISSSFIHRNIPFNQTWVFMDKLFHLEKFYVKEFIYFQAVLILIIMFYKKPNPLTQFFFGIIINGNINVICYDSKNVVPICLRYISQNDYNNLSPLHIPMKWQDIITD